MSKGNTFENDVIKLVVLGTAFSWNANGSVYVGLHTADPGEAGNQTTSEATYGSYARVAVARTAGGWTVAGNQASNAGIVTFPQATSGSSTVTHVSVGTGASGVGQLLYSAALSSSLAVASPIQPNFPIGSLVITED